MWVPSPWDFFPPVFFSLGEPQLWQHAVYLTAEVVLEGSFVVATPGPEASFVGGPQLWRHAMHFTARVVLEGCFIM